ncbi:MAG: triose-phosphate isomerase [Candidatus Peregrinibacteria bacterium Greene0416_19]|nr:MAG: triose-phosphate isomerase [Candidatus Peregrinibacteria bacterium Greene0416_19]
MSPCYTDPVTRPTLIAANWKMNPPPEGWNAIESPYRQTDGVDIVVFPPFVYLKSCIAAGLRTGAQCGHPEPAGAHTGCISMAMTAQEGCEAVLCGHSDRRRDQKETDNFIAEQVVAAFENKLFAILCIGETEKEREAGREREVVERQLQSVLDLLQSTTYNLQAIAYEPVWAIGTGRNATPEQAQEMHAFIRSLLPETHQSATRILYGGSMNAANAEELLRQPDIDGGLVGGASLKSEEFRKIVAVAAVHHR